GALPVSIEVRNEALDVLSGVHEAATIEVVGANPQPGRQSRQGRHWRCTSTCRRRDPPSYEPTKCEAESVHEAVSIRHESYIHERHAAKLAIREQECKNH